jgi:hypothetical protein
MLKFMKERLRKVTLRGPRRVRKGKRATLKATVQPCASTPGGSIKLFRGKKRIASKDLSSTCTATFKPRIMRTSTFRAVSFAGTSNKLKIRAR